MTQEIVDRIGELLKPNEQGQLVVMIDNRTGAHFIECHIRAESLISYGTTDVPLDPEDQSEYRANREMVLNAPAFKKMKFDAVEGRTFSNIVAEFSEDFEPELPLKIIGGQHRYEAIKLALEGGVNEWHGVKIYFNLDKDQRLDVQLISNTSIAISPDLYDRMQETVRGPELRDWCQKVGLLSDEEDFTDKRKRGSSISVQYVKTFILNFFAGREIAIADFQTVRTQPIVSPKGQEDEEWEEFLQKHPEWAEHEGLRLAGTEFAKLDSAQTDFFEDVKAPADRRHKAMNLAVLSAWALIAGCLSGDAEKLSNHFALKDAQKTDPLNAEALADGRHKSDAPNYRGLGYRTDAKERGRLAELFFYQADKGELIDAKAVDVAIKRFHAKQAYLDAKEAEED